LREYANVPSEPVAEWEYLIMTWDYEFEPSQRIWLDKMGADGWELVQFLAVPNGVYFKRLRPGGSIEHSTDHFSLQEAAS
jgi:hypothetical protein